MNYRQGDFLYIKDSKDIISYQQDGMIIEINNRLIVKSRIFFTNPIILTDEILDACGFKKKSFCIFSSSYSDLTITQKQDGYHICNKLIHYVHEMQQIIRNNEGIEIEADLKRIKTILLGIKK